MPSFIKIFLSSINGSTSQATMISYTQQIPCKIEGENQWSTVEYNSGVQLKYCIMLMILIHFYYNNFILRSAPLGTNSKRSKILSEPLHSTSTRHLLMHVRTVTKQIPDLTHFLDFKFNHKRYGRMDKIQQVHKKKNWF